MVFAIPLGASTDTKYFTRSRSHLASDFYLKPLRGGVGWQALHYNGNTVNGPCGWALLNR